MKPSDLKLKIGDRLKIGLYERDGIYCIAWWKNSYSLVKDYEIIYSDKDWCVLSVPPNIQGGVVSYRHINNGMPGLLPFLGQKALFLEVDQDYNFLEVITTNKSSSVKFSSVSNNGSFCKKCNRHNEYVDQENYICYECR